MRRLERGTRIRLSTQAREYYGTVLEGRDYSYPELGESPDWHVTFVHDQEITGFVGPGNWKSRVEGGTITILPCWNCGKENPMAPCCEECGQLLTGPSDSPVTIRFQEISEKWGR